MDAPAIWELKTANHSAGHVRWLGGPLLICDLPRPFSEQVVAWFYQAFRQKESDDITLPQVRVFFREVLAQRVPGLTGEPSKVWDLPTESAWLASITPERAALRGEVDTLGWRSNRWPETLTPEALILHTKSGAVTWHRQDNGAFSAGGWCIDGSEQWLDLNRHNGLYTLVCRRRGQVHGTPDHQRSAWFWKSHNQKLHAWLESHLR